MRSSWRLRCAAAIFTALVLPAPVWAGAWTLPRERWYIEYFYRYFGSKKEFDAEGNSGRRARAATFRDIRNELKLEYGLSDALNLLASVPYQSSHFRDDNVDLLTTNVGDIHVRTKLRLLTQPVVGSLQFSWKIPSAYNPNESPALGDGQVDFESRLQLSRSFTFRPYKVPAAPQKAAGAPAQATTASREAAIRQAVLTATLHERGRALWDAGRWEEAEPWLRAALENDPTHLETFRLLAQLISIMDDAPLPRPRLVGAYAYEPIFENATPARAAEPEGETRYAGIAFLNFESAFTARNEDPANEIPLLFEAGFTPLKRLMLVGSIESVLSLKATQEQEEDFSKWGLRAIVNVWGDGFASVFREDAGPTVNVEIGYTDIFYGRNTADAFEIFGKLGIFF